MRTYTIFCCGVADTPTEVVEYGEAVIGAGNGPATLWLEPLLLWTRPALGAARIPAADARRAGISWKLYPDTRNRALLVVVVVDIVACSGEAGGGEVKGDTGRLQRGSGLAAWTWTDAVLLVLDKSKPGGPISQQ